VLVRICISILPLPTNLSSSSHLPQDHWSLELGDLVSPSSVELWRSTYRLLTLVSATSLWPRDLLSSTCNPWTRAKDNTLWGIFVPLTELNSIACLWILHRYTYWSFYPSFRWVDFFFFVSFIPLTELKAYRVSLDPLSIYLPTIVAILLGEFIFLFFLYAANSLPCLANIGLLFTCPNYCSSCVFPFSHPLVPDRPYAFWTWSPSCSTW